MTEVNVHFRIRRVGPGDLYERLTNVETGDSILAEFCQFDCEISGARRYFKYSATAVALGIEIAPSCWSNDALSA